MQVQKVSEFAKSRGFVQIVPSIRRNVNNFPFLTFIDGENQAENIYFSKAAAKKVTDGQEITLAELAKFSIGYTLNAAKEERVKLISNSARLELSDLDD